MRSALLTIAFTPLVVLAAPTVNPIDDITAIDWERELLPAQSAELVPRARTEKSIDAIFKSLGKLYFGTCADATLLNNAQNADVLKSDFGQLTPENR
jgi:endo-1,4-beta-xylanase